MLSLYKTLFFLSTILIIASCDSDTKNNNPANTSSMEEAQLWVGTYTRKEGHVDGKAKGIYKLQLAGQNMEALHTQEDIINPSFVCSSPGGDYLYAVSELGPGADSSGYVYSYQKKGDQLELINRRPTYSFAPCHVSVHPNGQWLYVTNYVGGMIVRYPLAKDGSILAASSQVRLEGSGPSDRQEDSHPHSATLSPDGNWVMVADLGTDLIHSYRSDSPNWEEVSSIPLPAGAGPRHMTFHPKAAYAYVVNELNSSVTAFHYNADNGALNIIDHYPTLPQGVETYNVCADIHLTPNGRYLYATNRGHNSLAAYEVDSTSGRLKAIGYFSTRGEFPRNFAIHPGGHFLLVANQNTDNIVQYKIVPETGQLVYKQEWEVKTPVCIAFEK